GRGEGAEGGTRQAAEGAEGAGGDAEGGVRQPVHAAQEEEVGCVSEPPPGSGVRVRSDDNRVGARQPDDDKSAGITAPNEPQEKRRPPNAPVTNPAQREAASA